MGGCRVSVWWKGNRKESPEECARRTLALMEGLIQTDPLFSTLQTTSRKRGKYVDEPLPFDVDGLARLFSKGVNRSSVSRTVKKELGFRLMASTPGKDYAALDIHCGVYDSPFNSNECRLDLPSRGPDAERLVNARTVEQFMRLMVDAFEPDYGLAGEFEFKEAVMQDRQDRWERSVSWIMYFSRACGTVPPLPAPVRISPVGNRGMVIVMAPEFLVASNPDHVAHGRLVRALLKKSGVLDRPRPVTE